MYNKLIFSTKGIHGIGGIIGIIVVVLLFAPIFAIYSSPLAIMLTLGYACIASIILSKELGMRKSYIDLYEDHIEGKTMPEKWFGAINEMRSFQLEYTEITQVTSKTNLVCIVCLGIEYIVQAEKCEQKVIQIINEKRHLASKNI